MKVLGLINKDSGPGFHRVLNPLLHMEGIDTRITNNVTEEELSTCDAIYYNRVISDAILESRDKHGFKIIVDVDDYWRLDPHHISYSHYIEQGFEALQIKHLQLADLVTTTHERLAEVIYPYNKNVIITPNAIPDQSEYGYFNLERTESEKIRLFWQGSITHEKDIELLRNPFKRLSKDFACVMAGYSKHEAWDRMVSSFTNGLSIKGTILPGSSPFEYYRNYSHADICLAPLIDSRFNGFKSNLKVLEAAHAGLPVIASKVNPYLDLPILYVEKQSDWLKHINKLRDPQLRKDIGYNLKSYCNTHFNFSKINSYRLEEFKNLINQNQVA